MPARAWRPCKRPGCPNLVKAGYCLKCAPHQRDRRGTTAERGYGADWKRLRAEHLASHPTCRNCGAGAAADAPLHVDHRIPHRGDDALRLDPGNLTTLCRRCHTQKSREDGDFAY